MVDPALAGDDGAGGTHPGVEADRVQHERAAGDQLGAERGPQPAGEPAGGAGEAGRRVGPAGSRRARRLQTGRERRTARGSAPFCGPNTRAAILERGADVAQDDESRAPPRPPRDCDRARARRRRRPSSRCRRRRVDTVLARRRRRRRRSARRCPYVLGGQRITLSGRDEAETARRRRLHDRDRARAARTGASIGRPRGSRTRAVTQLAAPSGGEHVQRALAAVRERAQATPAPSRRRPRPIASATSRRRERPLEAVRGDEDWWGLHSRHRDRHPVRAMAETAYDSIEAAGREVRVSNPARSTFPQPGITKLDLIELLPGGRRRRTQPSPRPPDGAQALRRRDRRRAVLPEADPRQRAGLAADDRRHLPERPAPHGSCCPTTPPTSCGASTSA